MSTLEVAPTPERVGKVVAGKYRLDRMLGEGGMGAVYEAENLWTSRRVAIKLLRPEYLSRPDTVRRFLQEARAASKVEHPNIVDVFDMGQDDADGALFIVQELLQDQDLDQRLKAGPPPSLGEVASILVPILDALEAAHERGIIHRDIKPANIFLSVRGGGAVVPKLIDFGISKALDDEGFHKTRTGTTVGTPYYMSPEQARGEATLDVRTDVWSIAAVLFEMLTGRGPYQAANYNQLIIRIVTERPPRVETLAPDTPADLADALHAALETDLDKRLPTIRAFRDALQQCASFRVGAADSLPPRALSSSSPSLKTAKDTGHADTLPSSPSSRVPDFDQSVPGHPVTIRPQGSNRSRFAALAALGLVALAAVFVVRHNAAVAPSSLSGSPPNASVPPLNVPGTPSNVPGTPPSVPGAPSNVPGTPPNVPESPPNVPAALPNVPEAQPNRPAPVHSLLVVRGRPLRDAGVAAPVRPTTPPVAQHTGSPTPGDLLRPGIHYPGVRPDGG